MSSTPLLGVTEWYQEGIGTQLPPGQNATMAAAAPAITKGQLGTYDASGNVSGNDGTVANQVAAGVFDEMVSETSAQAGVARAHFWEGYGFKAQSSAAGDGFTSADIGGVPFFIADENTVGRRSNPVSGGGSGGTKRSFGGIAWGVSPDGLNLAKVWGGRVASIFARLLHTLNNESAGNYTYAQDATASTDLGSATGGPPMTTLATIGFFLARPKRVGVVTGVEIIPSAALSAAGTNYRVIQIWKVDTTGTVALASSPLVATFTTATQALVAGQPTAFTLSGTASVLNFIETDLFVGTSMHVGSGATVPLSLIRTLAKVI